MRPPFASQSCENRGASSRLTRASIHQLQPTTNADKLSVQVRLHLYFTAGAELSDRFLAELAS